jgi:hypothetical protein
MMFEAYSKRGVHVMFVARLKAGERGAEMLDVDDLLTALIIEDQGMRREALAGLLGRGDESGGRSLKLRAPLFALWKPIRHSSPRKSRLFCSNESKNPPPTPSLFLTQRTCRFPLV